jgi:hypothetical protein
MSRMQGAKRSDRKACELARVKLAERIERNANSRDARTQNALLSTTGAEALQVVKRSAETGNGSLTRKHCLLYDNSARKCAARRRASDRSRR